MKLLRRRRQKVGVTGFYKKIKRLSWAVFYVSLVPFILIAAGLIALQTEPAREAAIQFIEETIAQHTRAVCRIDKLNGNLISQCEITGLEITDAASGRCLLSAKRVEASYSIPMLLRRIVWINRLTLSGVNIRLIQGKDGSWNFEILSTQSSISEGTPNASSPASEFQDFRIKLRRLTIENSDISVTQPSDDGERIMHFKGMECRARLDVGDQITADIRNLALQSTSPSLDIRDVSGEVRFDAEESRLFLKDVRVVGKKSEFTLNGGLTFSDPGPDAAPLDMISMDLHADILKMSMGEFGRVFPIRMPDSDLVSGDIRVTGPVSNMDCRVDLHMDDLWLKSQGTVTIDAAYDVGLDISGRFGNLDLSALPVLDLDFLPGNLNADFSLVWQQIGMPEQSGSIRLDMASSDLRGVQIEQADVDVRIDKADFIFEKLNINTPFGRVRGSGRLTGFMDQESDNLVQLAAEVKAVKPDKVLQNEYFHGNINGIIGAFMVIPRTFDSEKIIADASCRIRASRMLDIDISSADIDAAWRSGKIVLNQFEVKTGIGTARASGWASVDDEALNLKFSAALPDIAPLKSQISALADVDHLSGRASLRADITGEWQAPDIQAQLKAENLVVKDISAESVAIHGQWNGAIHDFRDFQATAQCVVGNIHLDNVKIPVMNLKTTLTPSVIQGEITLHGEEKESLALSGRVRQWLDPVKEIVIDRVSLVALDQPPLVNRDPVNLKITGNRVIVEAMSMNSGNASLSLKGQAVIQPAGKIDALLSLRDFNLKRISGFVEGGDKIQGRLSLDCRLSGVLEKPVIRMTASVKEASRKGWPEADISVDLDYNDTQANLTGTVVRRGRQFMDISGSVSMDLSLLPFGFALKPESFLASVHLNQVDVSWISDIINDPEYGVSGILNAEAAFAGDIFNPGIKGRLQLDQGTLTLKKQGLVYETVSARLRFENDTIIIDDLNILGDKEGSLSMSGMMTYDHFTPRTFNIQAVGENLYIPFHSGVDARTNATLQLSGTWEAPVVSGKIEVPEGRVDLDRFLEQTSPEIEIVPLVSAENGVLKIPDKEPEPLHFVDPLAADIDVKIPNDFWIRGKDEYIEIKGKVRLKKNPHKPFVLYGSVLPVRGTYRFRGKLFQITRGELTFTGQEDMNPFVDIEAQNTINDVTIIIRATGTFEKINLVLDSEPAMDQSAIISYLIFGRAPDELSEKETFQAGEAALSFTGQIAADKLRDIIGDALGIDYLSISAGESGLHQGSLTMGKYVLPKVFVTFRQGFDETVTQKLEVTYEINKHFDLETQIDSEETSALDLIWKYEF